MDSVDVTHQVYTYYGIPVYIATCFSVRSEKYLCPRSGSWTFSEATTQGVLRPLCYSIGRARSFQEALSSCHAQHARVFSLSDYYSDYLTPSGESLVDLLASNGKIQQQKHCGNQSMFILCLFTAS